MASGRNLEEKVVKETWEHFQRMDPDEFKKLAANVEKKEQLMAAVRSTVGEVVKLTDGLHSDMSPSDIESHLAKHLSADRVELIKKGLTIPTYQVRLNKRFDGHASVDITRDKKEFMPSINLETVADVNAAKWIQIASIIVEAVLLVMSAVGITVEVSDAIIKKTAVEVVEVVESSSLLQKAVKQLEEAFHSGSSWDKAKAIFTLIKDSNSAGILWNIIKSLCQNMSAWDWIKTAVIVTAQIIAAVATEGLALIAKIVLALNSAYDFIRKVINISELNAMKQ